MFTKTNDQWIRPFLNLSKDKQQRELVEIKMAIKSRDNQINELLHLVDTLEKQLEEQEQNKDIPLTHKNRMIYREP